MNLLFFYTILIIYNQADFSKCETPEEEHGVKYASKCEVCKVLATELEDRLTETGKSHEVFASRNWDWENKREVKYQTSELRLIETLEGVCDRILQYNVHKEREDSTRFAKGMSQTFQTLHGLVDKGVKVELGIPYELWDKPSAEVTHMKTQCEALLEQNDADIDDWYHHHQHEESLKKYLCEDRALKGDDTSCLYETLKPKGDTGKTKKRKGKKDEL